MDALEGLRLQFEWGADEALLDTPQDRRVSAPSSTLRAPAPPPHAPLPMARQPAPAPATLPAGPAEAGKLAAACQTLDELQAALNSFTGCALRSTATQIVFADGAQDASLIIVGEAPGAEEDRAGRPFIGPAGQLLDRMLGSIGLDRRKVRIINTVPWRPPGDRAPSEADIALCLPFLHRHIALIRPRGLLALGGVAAKALLPESGSASIRRLRGQWHQAQIAGLEAPLPCLPSYHPAYLLRTPAAKAESWQDCLTLREWLATPSLVES